MELHKKDIELLIRSGVVNRAIIVKFLLSNDWYVIFKKKDDSEVITCITQKNKPRTHKTIDSAFSFIVSLGLNAAFLKKI